MAREDRALYPLCEQVFGPYGAVSVMRTDHASITASLVAISASTKRNVATKVDRLARLLEGHLAREERVLFPMMAALLSGTEMDRLARELRS